MSNIEIENHLDELADQCCESLRAGKPASSERMQQLLKALLMSGYARQDGVNLQLDLESRVKQQCTDESMHRGGALSAITTDLQAKFDELVRWESSQPNGAQQNDPATK